MRYSWLVFAFMLSACSHEQLHLVNNSDEFIAIEDVSYNYYSQDVSDRKPRGVIAGPETYNYVPNGMPEDPELKGYIQPHSTYLVREPAGCMDFFDKENWKSQIRYIPRHKLVFYVYTQQLMKEHSWSEIVENDLYSRKYELTREELDAINWQLTYP